MLKESSAGHHRTVGSASGDATSGNSGGSRTAESWRRESRGAHADERVFPTIRRYLLSRPSDSSDRHLNPRPQLDLHISDGCSLETAHADSRQC